jgi:hypothetical protein
MDVFPANVPHRRRRLGVSARRHAWPFGKALVLAVLFLGLASARADAAGPLHPDPGAVESSRGARFEQALAAMRGRLAQLELAPANQDGPSIRGLVLTLADAVENVPDARDVDVDAVARTLRDDFPYGVDGSPLDAGVTTEPIRESLAVVADALFRIARGTYASVPGVANRAKDLQRAADAIDPDRSVNAQRSVIFEAFDRADAALAAIDDASGTWPRAAATTPGSSALARSSSWGVREMQADAPTGTFSALVSKSAVETNRVASARAERAPEALRRAFDALSDAIGAAPPGERGERAVSPRDVVELHALARAFEVAPALSSEQTRRARRVLERAHRALAAATRSYARESTVVSDVRSFGHSLASLDGSRPLGAQLDQTFLALQLAERVLSSMEAADPPRTTTTTMRR